VGRAVSNRHDRRRAAALSPRFALVRIDFYGAGDDNTWCAFARVQWREIAACSPQCSACGTDFNGALPAAWLRIQGGKTALGALCNSCEAYRLIDRRGAAEKVVAALRRYGGLPDLKIIGRATVHRDWGRASTPRPTFTRLAG